MLQPVWVITNIVPQAVVVDVEAALLDELLQPFDQIEVG